MVYFMYICTVCIIVSGTCTVQEIGFGMVFGFGLVMIHAMARRFPVLSDLYHVSGSEFEGDNNTLDH
jgi:hypothetical protein